MPEKFCPVCKYKNKSDATVCIYCGAKLDQAEDGPTTTRNVEVNTGPLAKAIRESIPPALKPPQDGIAIYSLTSDHPITVQQADQFILGRRMTGEMDESFFDLRPFGAYENGVSRRHAMIRRVEDGYEIVDLGSTNGTWLNNQRIVPNRPYPLDPGVKVNLGRLQLFVMFQRTAAKS